MLRQIPLTVAMAAGWLLIGPLAAPGHAQAIRVEGLPDGSPVRALLIEQARLASRDAGRWFQTEVAGPVTIAWVTGASELAAYAGGDPGPVAGLAVARRNLVVLFAPALQSRPDRIVGVLRHEICHLAFAAATARAEVEPPRWLNEGVAMRWSGEWDLGSSYRTDQSKLLRDANAAGSLMRFRDLDATFPQGPFFHVAYAQSRSFVDWLIRRAGEESLQAWIARIGADEDPDPSFASVYGLSFSDAEEAWRKDVGGGALGRLPSATVLFNAAWGLLGLLVVVRFVVVRWKLRRAVDDPEEDVFPSGDSR